MVSFMCDMCVCTCACKLVDQGSLVRSIASGTGFSMNDMVPRNDVPHASSRLVALALAGS